MKMLLPALLLLLSLATPLLAETPADEKRTVLFTEKEFNAGGGSVVFTNAYIYIRVTVEYVAEKPLSLVVKPSHNAFMGLWRRKLSAASEPWRETCDFYSFLMPAELRFQIEGGGMREVRKLTVESISDAAEYRPSTTIPNPLRKTAVRHAQIKKAYAAAPPHPVVLFGDSLTDNWRGSRFAYMTTNFPVVNAGICGDRIEHLLWRLEDMRDLLTNNPPSVATFLIGTNNLGLGANPKDVALGVEMLLKTLHALCPETKLVVFAIPPRGFPWRVKPLPFPGVANSYLSSYVKDRHDKVFDEVFFLDFSELLLDASGAIRPEYYERDALHFSDRGYAEVVTPFVAGAIRLVTARNLPSSYKDRMEAWEEYLSVRLVHSKWNFATEEMLACETHLAALPRHWMKVFSKLEADPDYTPEMPDEYVRQESGEGLPDSVKQVR